jgi:hypothetical protein
VRVWQCSDWASLGRYRVVSRTSPAALSILTRTALQITLISLILLDLVSFHMICAFRINSLISSDISRVVLRSRSQLQLAERQRTAEAQVICGRGRGGESSRCSPISRSQLQAERRQAPRYMQKAATFAGMRKSWGSLKI